MLERYDEALAKKKEEALKQERLQQELRQRKPVSMPVRPNQPNHHTNNPQRPFPPTQQQQQQMQQQQQQMHNQPILPPPRTEPQWYDKIVDALVGDAGPETKYALICAHCFNHNGLVAKEEFDTIRKVF